MLFVGAHPCVRPVIRRASSRAHTWVRPYGMMISNNDIFNYRFHKREITAL